MQSKHPLSDKVISVMISLFKKFLFIENIQISFNDTCSAYEAFIEHVQ